MPRHGGFLRGDSNSLFVKINLAISLNSWHIVKKLSTERPAATAKALPVLFVVRKRSISLPYLSHSSASLSCI